MDGEKKVLIVEDDESVRKVLRGELEKRNIQVQEAENGESAFSIALEERPSLILLDVIMPKMHGMELLRKLQEDEWGKTVPVILLTNYAEDPQVASAVEEGKCDLLSKSESTLDDIIAAIEKKFERT